MRSPSFRATQPDLRTLCRVRGHNPPHMDSYWSNSSLLKNHWPVLRYLLGLVTPRQHRRPSLTMLRHPLSCDVIPSVSQWTSSLHPQQGAGQECSSTDLKSSCFLCPCQPKAVPNKWLWTGRTVALGGSPEKTGSPVSVFVLYMFV